MWPQNSNVLSYDSPALPVSVLDFYEDLVERTDALAGEHEDERIAPIMRELARFVAAEGASNAIRRSADEWARGIALTAVIAILIDEPLALESDSLRAVFLDSIGPDLDATAQCTADVLVSAGVLDIGADWSLPS